jgi:hypothetical protein
MRVLVACEYSGVVRDAFKSAGHDAWSCDLLPSESIGAHYEGDVRDMLEGWEPVQFTSQCDPDGSGWCHSRDVDLSECSCIGPTQDGIEYIEKNGILFGRPIDHPHWDLMIAHPPCTYLCASGMHWNSRTAGRSEKTEEALEFVKLLMDAPIHMIALENPIGCISTRIRKSDQIIQPWQFGSDASKATCIWLKNLPLLVPTKIYPPRIVNGKKRWGNQVDSGQNKLAPTDDRWKIRSRTYQGIADAMAQQWGGNN